MDERKFLKHQAKFLESTKREVVLSGGYGSGKSLALCNKIVYLSLRFPNNRGFLCRKLLQHLSVTTLKTLLQGDGDVPPVLPKHLIATHNKNDRIITLKNGSEIIYGQFDLEYVKSMNLGWFAVDELSELTEDEWNAGLNRLRLNNVPVWQALGVTNPSSELHWIFQRFVTESNGHGLPVKLKDTDKKTFILSKTTDNYLLPKDYIDNLNTSLVGYLYKRFVLGLWAGSGKLIYDNFSMKNHVIEPFTPPENIIKRFRSIDFGYTSPFVCHFYFMLEKDYEGYKKGDVFLEKEIYYTRRVISQNAQRILDFSKRDTPEDGKGNYYKFVANVADWDSGDRAELEAAGIRTIKGNKDILSGVQKVKEYLGNDDSSAGPIVRPKFYIFRNCSLEYDPKLKINPDTGERENKPSGAIDEFQVYSWKLDRHNKIKDEPEDDNNHAMDAIRMLLNTITTKPQWSEIEFKSL